MWSLRKLSLTFIASLLLCAELFQPFALSLKNYRDTCSEDRDCQSGYCNLAKRECDCGAVKELNSRAMAKQFYDPELKICLSRVDQMCTLNAGEDGLAPFICTPSAVCTTTRSQAQSRLFFGFCSCKPDYQQSEDRKRCISNAELRTGKVSSMDLVSPEGLNRSGSWSFMQSSKFEMGGLILLSALSTTFCLFPFR